GHVAKRVVRIGVKLSCAVIKHAANLGGSIAGTDPRRTALGVLIRIVEPDTVLERLLCTLEDAGGLGAALGMEPVVNFRFAVNAVAASRGGATPEIGVARVKKVEGLDSCRDDRIA